MSTGSNGPSEELILKIESSVEEALRVMVRGMISNGMPPMDVIEMIERRVSAIRSRVENAIDGGVSP